MVIGRGKASHLELPEDQSLDNMLDHHAINPLPDLFYLSSYVLQPAFMGNYRNLPPGTTYLGELDHEFMDIMFQFSLRTTSRVYIGTHHYPNVYSVFIRTDYNCLRGVWDLDPHERDPGYDYVLTFFIRGMTEESSDLRKTPEKIEMLLLLLANHMGLDYTEVIFTPSKTWLGKLVRPEFPPFLKDFSEKGPSEEERKELLQNYLVQLSDRMEPQNE